MSLRLNACPAGRINIHGAASGLPVFEMSSADAGNTWLREDGPALDGVDVYLAADSDAAGAAVHLVFATYASNRMQYVKRTLPADGQAGAWHTETFTNRKTAQHYFKGFDVAVDSTGTPHVVYGLQYASSQDVYWSAELWHCRSENGGWSNELVATRAAATLDAAFHNPQAAWRDGVPVIVAHLRYNVMTGSDAGSQLFCARLDGIAGWQTELIAQRSDGYAGSDGDIFTGLSPDLAVDSAGRIHVSFSDLASWHVGGYQQAWMGQMRYAVHAGSWQLSVPFPQDAAAHEALGRSIVLPTVSGDEMAFVG